MARIITDPREAGDPSTQLGYYAYCCMDSMIARECFDVLYPRLSPADLKIYLCDMAFCGPTLAMSLRGVRVDERAVAQAIKDREEDERKAIENLRRNPEVRRVWDKVEPWKNERDGMCPATGKSHNWTPKGAEPVEQKCSRCEAGRLVPSPLNTNSAAQIKHLLYDLLGMKPRFDRKTGNATVGKEALQALARKYPEHAGVLDDILTAKAEGKQVSMLKCKRDADGRWRASFNVTAAETGRMSSSKSARRTGSNLQNIADKSRNIFIADPGMEIGYADLSQAESTIVAYAAGCPQDIEDHEAGDTHTALCKTIFPRLPWGSAPDRKVAEAPLPWNPDSEYRQVGKIVRHGTNIGMTPVGIQRLLRCTLEEAREYRDAYFRRYPENLIRQQEIRRQVKETGALTNHLGRTRVFLGRLWDEQTMKEALAQDQQSTVAGQLNTAMWRVWWELDTRANISAPPRLSDPNKVWLLGQIHDAILFLFRKGDDETLTRIQEIMTLPILVNGVPVRLKSDMLIGPTWRKSDMRKWHG